jgi:hypothetical protein
MKCFLKSFLGIIIVCLFGCKTPQCKVLYNTKDFNMDFCNNIALFKVGNPLGNTENDLTSIRYFDSKTRWYGTVTASVLWGGASIFCPPMLYGLPVVATFGYGSGRAMEAYYGGPFDYDSYNIPKEKETIVFWFSGADEGACGHRDFGRGCDYCNAAREYGDECVAMFNFSDIDKAVEYANKLPEGTQLIVRGHSMGGSAAIRFVNKLPSHIKVLLLDTRDPTSWFGQKKDKPVNVIHWRNVLPGDKRCWSNSNEHRGTNYVGHFNMANVFMFMGRPWGVCHGATNVIMEGKDHHEVGRNIDR